MKWPPWLYHGARNSRRWCGGRRGKHLLHACKEEGDSIGSTVRGTMKVASPTIFGKLIDSCCLLALANVEGKMGQIYAQFGTVVTICLLLSLAESKFILPSHLAHINTKRSEKKGLWARVQHAADTGLGWLYKPHLLPCDWMLKILRCYAVVMAFFNATNLSSWITNDRRGSCGFLPWYAGRYGDCRYASIDAKRRELWSDTTKLVGAWSVAAKTDETLRAQYGAQDEASELLSLQVIADADDSGQVRIELDSNSVYTSNEFADLWEETVGQMEGVTV